jgi:ribosomal protein S18 acetylase RimI-like enzyme
LRLAGLRDRPKAFGASYEDEVLRPHDWFADRLERNVVIGGWREVSILVGVVGLHIPEAVKSSHKGELWGMFVSPEARRTRLATALLAQLTRHAASVVDEIRLAVGATNVEAVRLYEKAGFTACGLDRRALKVNGRYYDNLLMTLPLRPDRQSGGLSRSCPKVARKRRHRPHLGLRPRRRSPICTKNIS